jgi:hypothetical protein
VNSSLRTLACCVAAALLPAMALAVPYRPPSDTQVLERVPSRATDARTREIEALRAAWQRNPNDRVLAVKLARRWYDEALAQGRARALVGRARTCAGRAGAASQAAAVQPPLR